jgi:uncharacterized protein
MARSTNPRCRFDTRRGMLLRLAATGATLSWLPHVAAAEPPLTLLWKDLLPAQWSPALYFRSAQASGVSDLQDDDPRAKRLFAALKAEGRRAPPVQHLAGKHVRIAGMVTPVRANALAVSRFTLGPFLGGCIHKPPPPANQLVLVQPREALPLMQAAYPVWVQGLLQVRETDTPAGYAAYLLRDAQWSAFDATRDRAFLPPYPRY